MTASGTEHLRAVEQVREFFQELASLLLTADSLMAKANWVSRTGNSAVTTLSYSLGSPRQWLPNCLCRSYGDENRPTLVPIISAVLGVNGADRGLLTEPLVTAALYTYDAEARATNDKFSNFADWHLWIPDRRDNGAICNFDPRTKEDWSNYCGAVGIESFALPLLAITDARALDDKVVGPLLEMAERAVQAQA